jgi:hypothetical protein
MLSLLPDCTSGIADNALLDKETMLQNGIQATRIQHDELPSVAFLRRAEEFTPGAPQNERVER